MTEFGLRCAHFSLARELPLPISVKLWGSRAAASRRHNRTLRHEFVIGPLYDSNLSPGKARLYYCVKCKWSFLVSGSKVAVLGEDGSPLVGEESLRRFNTFEEGPCPVLEASASAAPPDVGTFRLPLRSKSDEPDKFGLVPAPGGRRSCPKGRAGEYRRRKRSWSPIHLV